MSHFLKYCAVWIVPIFFLSCCNHLYKAGNLVDLHYPIETSLRTKIVREYLDTLIQKHGFNVPHKWLHYDKLVDIDSVNHKRIYFRENPEELYLVSVAGMITLSDVYNPLIKQTDWISERKFINKEEEIRIRKRFKEDILDTIEAMAKRNGLPDSLIYKQ